MRRIASLCFVGLHISEGAHGNVLQFGLCNAIKGTDPSPRVVAAQAKYNSKPFYIIKVSLWVRREV